MQVIEAEILARMQRINNVRPISTMVLKKSRRIVMLIFFSIGMYLWTSASLRAVLICYLHADFLST